MCLLKSASGNERLQLVFSRVVITLLLRALADLYELRGVAIPPATMAGITTFLPKIMKSFFLPKILKYNLTLKGPFLIGNTKSFDASVKVDEMELDFTDYIVKNLHNFWTTSKKWPQCSYSAEQLSPSGSALVEHECQSNLCNPVVPQNFAGKTPVQEASGHLCFSVACTVAQRLINRSKIYCQFHHNWFDIIFFVQINSKTCCNQISIWLSILFEKLFLLVPSLSSVCWTLWLNPINHNAQARQLCWQAHTQWWNGGWKLLANILVFF